MSRPKKTNTAKILWIVILIGIAVFLYFKLKTPKNTVELDWAKRTIAMAGETYLVYEARTEIQRETGLSAFNSIRDNEGMLFYFDSLGKPTFWMKDMKFPIDIVWMKDWNVVQVDENIPVQPNDKLSNYLPREDINEVLELKAGTASKGNIKVGDVLQLN